MVSTVGLANHADKPEQMETDCKAAAEEIEEIEAAVAKGQKEHGVLEKSLATQKVCYPKSRTDAVRKTTPQLKLNSRQSALCSPPLTRSLTTWIAT